jgi:hypothetical protein
MVVVVVVEVVVVEVVVVEAAVVCVVCLVAGRKCAVHICRWRCGGDVMGCEGMGVWKVCMRCGLQSTRTRTNVQFCRTCDNVFHE